MIRVVLADDHPAVRVGLERLVRSEPGMILVGSAGDGSAALEEARRSHPDCMVVDYRMPGGGLGLCRRLKELEPTPGIVVFTAFAADRLQVAARIAGVNAVLDKSSPASDLFDAVRLAARHESAIEPSQAALSDVAAELSADQLPIFGMRIEGTPWSEIRETLRLTEEALDEQVAGLLEQIENRLEPSATAR